MTTDTDSTNSPTDTETDVQDISLSFDFMPSHTLNDLDGLTDSKKTLSAVVSALSQGANITTNSILIHGPRGTGKTYLAEAIAGELAAEEFAVERLQGLDDHAGQEGEAIAEATNEAIAAAPSVLVLDQLPEQPNGNVRVHLREALNQIHEENERVLVVATATPESVLVEARCLFGMSVGLEIPDKDRAATLVESYLDEYTEQSNVAVDVDLENQALRAAAAGLSAAELKAGTKRAFLSAIESQSGPGSVTTEMLRSSLNDVENNRPVRPTPFASTSSAGNWVVEETDVTFNDIGGLDDVKAELRAALEFPSQFEDTYASCNLETPGVLLYGEPGNGKTMLAKALATEYDRTFIAVNGPELKNKFAGGTEKNIRSVFETAREESPSIVFFDEFDALAADRDYLDHSFEAGFVDTLLTELDGFRDTSEVLIIGATNRPDDLDEAVLRDGRLGRHLHVPTPDKTTTQDIIATHTADFPLAADVTSEWIASRLPDGISAATITGICDQALRWHAMSRVANSDENSLTVTRRDFEDAIADYSEYDSSQELPTGFY